MKCNSFIRHYSLNFHYPLKKADMVNKTTNIMHQLIKCVDNITLCDICQWAVAFAPPNLTNAMITSTS